MSVSIKRLTKNLKHPVYLASYIPETDEKLWFGHIETSKKTGKRSFIRGRKPDRQSRSGDTPDEALRILYSYLDAAFQAYVEFNPDYREKTR